MNITRKDFLKAAGGTAAGAVSGIIFSGLPGQLLKRLSGLTEEHGIKADPGLEKFLSTQCTGCTAQCRIKVRLLDGKVIHFEPENNSCAELLSSLNPFSEKTVSGPMKNAGKGTGKFEPADPAEVLKEISSALRKSGNRTVFIDRKNSETLKPFALAAGGFWCPIPSAGLEEEKVLGGRAVYDLKNADLILSLGVQVYGGWNPGPDRQQLLCRENFSGRLIYAGNFCTETAALADEWLPVAPGTEAILAAGLASILVKKHVLPAAPGWIKVLDMSADQLCAGTGLSADRIEELVRALESAERPAVITRTGDTACPASSAEIMAVSALNLMLNKDYRLETEAAGPGKYGKKLRETAPDSAAGERAGTFIINQADPVFMSCCGKELKEKLKQSFVVSITDTIKETDLYADIILPAPSLQDRLMSQAEGRPDLTPEPQEWLSKIFHRAGMMPGKKSSGKKIFIRKHICKAEIFREQISRIPAEKAGEALTLIPLSSGIFDFPWAGPVLTAGSADSGTGPGLTVFINPVTGEKAGLMEGDSLYLESKEGQTGPFSVHLTNRAAPGTAAVHTGYMPVEKNLLYASNPLHIMNREKDSLTGMAGWLPAGIKAVKKS